MCRPGIDASLPKLRTRVRFPSPAPTSFLIQRLISALEAYRRGNTTGRIHQEFCPSPKTIIAQLLPKRGIGPEFVGATRLKPEDSTELLTAVNQFRP